MQPQQLLVILGILLTSSQVWCQSIGKVTFQDNNSEDQTEKQGNIRKEKIKVQIKKYKITIKIIK